MSVFCIRPMVLVPVRDHVALLAEHRFDGNGVFVPGYTKLESGTEVDFEIAFARERVSICGRGVVRWRRAVGDRRLPAGVGIEFRELDRRTRDLLADFAAGREVELVKRGPRRFPVELGLSYAVSLDEASFTGVTRDISRSGAAVIGPRAPAVGARLALHIEPPDDPIGVDVGGEVRWWRSEDQYLFGVRFVLDNPENARCVLRLVDRIKREVAAGRS